MTIRRQLLPPKRQLQYRRRKNDMVDPNVAAVVPSGAGRLCP